MVIDVLEVLASHSDWGEVNHLFWVWDASLTSVLRHITNSFNL